MFNRMILVSIMLMLPMISLSNPASAQEAPSWEIGWVEEHSDAVLLNSIGDKNSNDWWDRGGTVTLEFYIENTRVVEVTINLEFESDHEGEFDWVEVDLDESVVVQGQSNKTFSITIEVGSLNDVSEGSTHELRVIAQEDSLFPTTPQIIDVDTQVPRVAVMTADVVNEGVPVMAGDSMDVKVEITNLGNKNDGLMNSETKLTIDGCPQLDAEDDSSLFETVEPGATIEAIFTVSASSSHPSKSCIVTFRSSSAGLASVTDSIELEVRSSSSGNGGGSNGGGNNGENNGGGDGDDIESDEEVRANFLYSLSLASSLAIISIAALVRRFDTNCP